MDGGRAGGVNQPPINWRDARKRIEQAGDDDVVVIRGRTVEVIDVGKFDNRVIRYIATNEVNKATKEEFLNYCKLRGAPRAVTEDIDLLSEAPLTARDVRKLYVEPSINWHAQLDKIAMAPRGAKIVAWRGKPRVLDEDKFRDRILARFIATKKNEQWAKDDFSAYAERRNATDDFITDLGNEERSLRARDVHNLAFVADPVGPTIGEAKEIIEKKYTKYLANGKARLPKSVIYAGRDEMGDDGGLTDLRGRKPIWVKLQREEVDSPNGRRTGYSLHELLHCQSGAFIQKLGCNTIAEGFTELLMCEALGLERTYTTYGCHVALARHIRKTVRGDGGGETRDDIFLNAFFKGEIEPLAKAYDAEMGKGAFAALKRESALLAAEETKPSVDRAETKASLMDQIEQEIRDATGEAPHILDEAAMRFDERAIVAQKERNAGKDASIAKVVLYRSAAKRLRQLKKEVVTSGPSEGSSSDAVESSSTSRRRSQRGSSAATTLTAPTQPQPRPSSRKGKEIDD